jgi:hypothetical protein
MCNIYLPPSLTVSAEELTNLIPQLPPPLILLGDFNAKNILWGAALTDERVGLVSDVSAGFDLILLNSGAHTHTHTALSWVRNLVCAGLVFSSPGLAVECILNGQYLQIYMATSLPSKFRYNYTFPNTI